MKSVLWLAIIGMALYLGYHWWEDRRSEGYGSAPASRAAQGLSGGPVRDWQQAPERIMDMQDAMGGADSGASTAARRAAGQGSPEDR